MKQQKAMLNTTEREKRKTRKRNKRNKKDKKKQAMIPLQGMADVKVVSE